jgi:hypothetical protein
MHQRFRWRNDTIESVHWDAFSKVFRARYRFRTFNFKLCFRLLPTGKTLHTRTHRYDPKCPACDHAEECNNHLFQCTAVSRRRWQSSCILTIRKQAETIHTDPKLVHIMLAGLRSYFDDTDLPSEEFSDYPEQYHDLITAQEAIGWDHLMRCRFSHLWGDLQQDYMYSTRPSEKFDSDTWYRKLLGPLLVECHTLWTLRNGERHGTEQKQKRTRRLQQLERDLHDLFKYRATVLASDHDIFDTPVSDLITLPPGEIEKWIKSRKPIILHSRREAIKKSITDVRLLPTYFPPLPRRRPRKPRSIFRRSSARRLHPTNDRPISASAQLMTEHFALVKSNRTKRPETFHPSPHRTLEQQPLLFGDNPT